VVDSWDRIALWDDVASASDVNLGTLHIHLGSRVTACCMESNNLSPEEVVSIGNASWDSDGHISLVGDHLCRSPCTTVQSILVNLEPSETRDGGRQRSGDRREVDHDGPKMRRIDRILRIAGIITSKGVMPLVDDGSSSRDVYDDSGSRGVKGIGSTVADHVVGCHISNGTIVRGITNRNLVSRRYTVDIDLLEDRMCRD